MSKREKGNFFSHSNQGAPYNQQIVYGIPYGNDRSSSQGYRDEYLSGYPFLEEYRAFDDNRHSRHLQSCHGMSRDSFSLFG